MPCFCLYRISYREYQTHIIFCQQSNLSIATYWLFMNQYCTLLYCNVVYWAVPPMDKFSDIALLSIKTLSNRKEIKKISKNEIKETYWSKIAKGSRRSGVLKQRNKQKELKCNNICAFRKFFVNNTDYSFIFLTIESHETFPWTFQI